MRVEFQLPPFLFLIPSGYSRNTGSSKGVGAQEPRYPNLPSMNEPRNHHYISQCYLKGFAETRSKDATLQVWDLVRKRRFATRSRNVASMRDFNRIEVEGLDPNYLETQLAQFESELDGALGRIIASQTITSDDDLAYVLNLMAMSLVRHPSTRDVIAHLVGENRHAAVRLALETKSQWDVAIQRMREAGEYIGEDFTYEAVRDYVEGEKFRLQVDRSYLNRLELQHFEEVLPYFFNRVWTIIQTDPVTAPFITSDRPLFMLWARREDNLKQPPPRLMDKSTLMLFPLSKELALFGRTSGLPKVESAGPERVAMINAYQLHNARSQIFAPHEEFRYAIGAKAEIRHHEHIFTDWSPLQLRDEGSARSPFPRTHWG